MLFDEDTLVICKPDYVGKLSKAMRKPYTKAESLAVAKKLDIDFKKVKWTVADWVKGMNVEREHGGLCADTNITHDSPEETGKIALVHLRESDTYYRDLDKYVEKSFLIL